MLGSDIVIAVITARGGSSLEGKNYRSICGRPLFEHSIEAALLSKKVDYVYLSTDCPKIKSIFHDDMNSHWYNNRVGFIDRPAVLATSVSKNEDALLHAVDQHDIKNENWAGVVVNLQPTSPIRKETLIDEALQKMYVEGKNSLMTVQKVSPLMVKKSGSKIEWMFNRLERPMRQEIEAKNEYFYHDDGCLYITYTDVLKKQACRLDENPSLYVNDSYSSFQVDEEEDFSIVEYFMNKAREKGGYI